MARSFFTPTPRNVFRTNARALAVIATALAVVCGIPATAGAAPGQLDTTFGHLGNGTVLADHGAGDLIVKVLHQPDGKIVTIAGTADVNHIRGVVVSRYLASGALDPSFATGGVFTERVAGGGDVADGVLQPDGKIVIAGTVDVPIDFFIQRLSATGALDVTFPAGHPFTNFGGTRDSTDQALTIALGPSGTIVVAGRSDSRVAIARYTSTGALDPTFSGDGLATHNFGPFTIATGVAVLPDAHIIVAGLEIVGATERTLVARFNANGSLDTTFGTGGRVSPAAAKIINANALLMQGTKPVVVGSVNASTSALVRYNANGTLDPTFGSGGTTLIQVGQDNFLTGLAADGSGRILASGQTAFSANFPFVQPFASLYRFSANGVRDASFGCGGAVLTEVLGNGAGTAYEASWAKSVVAAGNDIVVGGYAAIADGAINPPVDELVARYHADGLHTPGYALLRGDGGTSPFGGAPPCGSTAGLPLTAPIVGLAESSVARGNWTVASDGGVFAFGAARFHGSMGGTRLAQPIVGMAAAPDGQGYWLVARDGGVFSFGTAHFFGSTGAIHLNKPIVGMAAAKDGKGYWLVASDGGVFAFGSARFAGSTGAITLNKPIVGMAGAKDGKGYWLVASDGGVFSFGSAHFSGSTGAIHLAQPVVGIAADPDGTGYWLAARDGGVFAFAATFSGSTGATPFPAGSARSTIGIAATP